MADPLLTALCTICHVEAPKYKCPRCGARTCCLACVRKHKSWASCSGERDPAAFVPRERLRTEAGVDHDYNFISRIERARERFENEVTSSGRGLVSEIEIKGPQDGREDRRFDKVWYGDQLHHVPSTRGRGHTRVRAAHGRAGDDSRFPGGTDKHIRRRLRAHNIDVVLMPKGLLRQRQNKTAWNRRTNTINWQVEWLVFNYGALSLPTATGEDEPVQILHKALDEKPLYQALASSLEWYETGIKRAREDCGDSAIDDAEFPPRKKQKTSRRKQKPQAQGEDLEVGQDPDSTTWISSKYTLQYSLTGEWNRSSTAASVPTTKDEHEAELASLKFFLLKPGSSKDGSKHLIPLSPTEPLSEALSGRTVVEFPTIYVLDPAMALPSGFTLASTERRQRKPEPAFEEGTEPGEKRAPRRGRPFEGRQRGGRQAWQSRRDAALKRSDDAEEGEVDSEGEQLGADDDAQSTANSSISDDNGSGNDAFAADTRDPDDGSPQPEASRPSKGLVDYDSGSDQEE